MRVVWFLAVLLAGCTPQLPPAPRVATLAHALAPAGSPDYLMDDTRILSADDMQGRLAGSPGGAMARAYILKRFADIGLKPALGGAFEQPFPFKARGLTGEGANLIALVKGTSSSAKALVVMAHYDHVGVKNDQIYNGADDNASGIATLLLVAKSLKDRPPLHDVILAAVDAEEEGEVGSRFMVKNIPDLLPRITAAVNFDMISRSDKNEIYACGAFAFPFLRPRLEAIAAKAPVKLLLGHDDPALGREDDWTTQSDQIAFHLIGIPWVFIGVENHEDYHRPTDDFDRIPQDFFRRAAATAEMTVRAFDHDLDALAKEAGR